MSRVCRAGGSVVVALLGLMAATTLAAPAPAPPAPVQAGQLLFLDGSSAKLNGAIAGSTVKRELCHSGRFAATGITARAMGFDFLATAEENADVELFAVPDLGESLAAGGCRRVTIGLKPAAKIPAGEHAGSLVVTSTAGIATLPVTITNGKGKAKEVAPTPAVETAQLRDSPNGPPRLRAGSQHGEGMLPVKKPKDGETYKELHAGVFLGSLWNGEHRARVFARAGGYDTRRKDVWLLPVQFDRDGDVGDYTGKLDLVGDSDADHLIPVKLTVSDGVLWVIIAVVVGALCAVAAEFWIRRVRLVFWLNGQRGKLSGEYARARAAFVASDRAYADAFPGPEEGDEAQDGSIARYRAQIGRAVEDYGKTVWYFDTTSDAYKSIVESLRVAQRDSACLGAGRSDPAGLVGRLVALKAELVEVETVATDELGESAPAILAYGKGILKGTQLKVGGALKLAEEVEAHTKFATTWIGLAHRTMELTYWLVLLVHEVPDSDLGAGDRHALLGAAAKLAEAEHELITLETADDLADLASEADLDRARTLLTRVSAQHDVWPQAGAASLPVIQRLTLPPAVRTWVAAASGPLLLLGDSRAELLSEVAGAGLEREAQITSAIPAVVARKARRAGDFVVVIFSIATGVLTALNVSYFGKTFGTDGDYAAAFMVGVASQLLVSGLAATLGQMRAADAALIAVTPPTAAGVEVKKAA